MAKDELEREDLIRGINAVITKLRDAGEPAGIRIIGGAALAIRYFERRTTSDVDAQLFPEEPILRAAAQVAIEQGWAEDWLNSKASTFVPAYSADVEWEVLYQDDTVTVVVASAEALLALKLRASRLGRDEQDIATLLSVCGVSSFDAVEELMDKYYLGDGISDKAMRLLTAIYQQGLPPNPKPPAPPRFGPAGNQLTTRN